MDRRRASALSGELMTAVYGTEQRSFEVDAREGRSVFDQRARGRLHQSPMGQATVTVTRRNVAGIDVVVVDALWF